MTDNVIVGDIAVAPGESRTIDLQLPNLYTHTRMQMPVRVVRGRRDGPRLFVSAALHGDEINGVEIIRRLLALPALRRLSGTLIAVPVVNIYGFINHSRYLPDRRDLNRSFPGSDRGSMAARLANVFLREIVANTDIGIDLHTGAIHRSNLPQLRADLSNSRSRELAETFGVPVVLDSTPPPGSLRHAAAELREGYPLLVYEGGEALRFDELAIRAGVSGVVAVLRSVGMLPHVRARKNRPMPVIASRSSWVRASQSGIMRAAKPLGARVTKDDTLALVSDPFGDREEVVSARFSGIIIGRSEIPLVTEGEALFHVASVPRPGEVEEQVDAYHEHLAGRDELADPDDS